MIASMLHGLIAALTLAASSPSLTPPDDTLGFRPPVGWSVSHQALPMQPGYYFVGLWIAPVDVGTFHPNVNMLALPREAFDDELASPQALSRSGATDVVFVPTSCHGRRANWSTHNSTEHGGLSFAQLTIALDSGTVVTTYTRPIGSPFDPLVMASFESLCERIPTEASGSVAPV